MASAVPYEPEGFGAESNPFAPESTQPESPTVSEPRVGTEASEDPVDGATSASAAVVAPAPVKPVKKYKLVLKITGLERQGKKDPIFCFDAYVCQF